MRVYNITLIPGDGVGPEVIDSAVRCIECAGVEVKWDTQIAGENAIKKYKTPLPDSIINSIKKNGVALKGPITTPVGKGFRSVNVALRKSLDLFANIRPAKMFPGVETLYKNVDIVVIRENTEDLYSGIEFEKGKYDTKKLLQLIRETKKENLRSDSSVSLKIISQKATEKIVKFAFNYATENKRKKVTVVHKANILKYTDGLFLEVARRIAKKYPDIKFEDKIVDNMAMQLVQKPEQYDVLVTPNLYGDILSDLCAGLVGGLGLAYSGNIGEKYAVFEPVHGSAPKYAGKNKVNPTAAILAGVMMLKHLGEDEASDLIEKSVIKVLREGKHVTYDLKSNNPVGTKEMTKTIIKYMQKCK